MKGKGPFIVSERSPREVLSDLSSASFLGIWCGPALTVLAVWMLALFGSL